MTLQRRPILRWPLPHCLTPAGHPVPFTACYPSLPRPCRYGYTDPCVAGPDPDPSSSWPFSDGETAGLIVAIVVVLVMVVVSAVYINKRRKRDSYGKIVS